MPSTPWATSTLGLHLQFCQINTEGRMSMFLMQKNFPRAEVSDASTPPSARQPPISRPLNPQPASLSCGASHRTVGHVHHPHIYVYVHCIITKWTIGVGGKDTLLQASIKVLSACAQVDAAMDMVGHLAQQMGAPSDSTMLTGHQRRPAAEEHQPAR